MSHSPKEELESGVTILAPALTPHGFVFMFQDAGCGSGGNFAWGKYVRHDRSLHLHHRRGLGIIQYHIADLCIDHETYLKSLGVENQSDVLWMPLESGIDRYKGLRSDLERFCSDFLSGPAVEWTSAAIVYKQFLAARGQQRNACAVGDKHKRLKARELFREQRYADVVAILNSLHYPNLLEVSEEKMLQIARERANGT